jgi:hypothetical protein
MTKKEDFETHGFSKMSLWYCSVPKEPSRNLKNEEKKNF